jgi:hypothetical protein
MMFFGDWKSARKNARQERDMVDVATSLQCKVEEMPLHGGAGLISDDDISLSSPIARLIHSPGRPTKQYRSNTTPVCLESNPFECPALLPLNQLPSRGSNYADPIPIVDVSVAELSIAARSAARHQQEHAKSASFDIPAVNTHAPSVTPSSYNRNPVRL